MYGILKGTALKTVIARFSEVKSLYSKGQLTGQTEDGEEIDVNNVSKALRAAGIDLNEYLVGTKGLDEVFLELSSKWDSLDLVTQRYIATMAAGSRQQSRFLALMSDNARLTELCGSAYSSTGSAAKQFSKTEESLATKTARLQDSWDSFLMGIANASVIKGAVDVLDFLVVSLSHATAGFGGFTESLSKINLIVSAITVAKRLLEAAANSLGPKLYSIMKQNGEQAAQGFKEGLTGINAAFSETTKKALGKNTSAFSQGWIPSRGSKAKFQETRKKIVNQKVEDGWQQNAGSWGLSEDAANAENGQALGQIYGEKYGEGIAKGIEKGASKADALNIMKNNANEILAKDKSQLEQIEKDIAIVEQNREHAQLLHGDKNDSNFVDHLADLNSQKAEALSKIKIDEEVVNSFNKAAEGLDEYTESVERLTQPEQIDDYASRLQNVSLGLTGFTVVLGAASTMAEKFNLDGLSTALDGVSSVASSASTALNGVSMAAEALKAMGKVGMAEGLLKAGPYVAIAMAVIAALTALYEWYKKTRQEAIDAAKEVGETVKAQKEQIDSYDELLERKARGEDVDADLASSGKELVDSLGIENGELLLVAENWEAIAEAAKKARQEEAKTNYNKVKKGKETVIEDLTRNKFGTDANEIRGVENTSALIEYINAELKKKGLGEVTAKGFEEEGVVTIDGVKDLEGQDLLDYYDALDSAMGQYGAIYDNSSAVKSWDDFMDKVQDRLEELGVIVESENDMLGSYYELDENQDYKFNSEDEYNNWMGAEKTELVNALKGAGIDYDEGSTDLEQIILNAIGDAGLATTDLSWWKSFSTLPQEIRNYANNNATVMDALKSGKIAFSSDSTKAEIDSAIGKYYSDIYKSMGKDTANAADSYLDALGSGEEISDAIRSGLLESLDNVGLKEVWENGDYENKSYTEQADFLIGAIEQAESTQSSYYDNLLKSLGTVKGTIQTIAKAIETVETEESSSEGSTETDQNLDTMINDAFENLNPSSEEEGDSSTETGTKGETIEPISPSILKSWIGLESGYDPFNLKKESESESSLTTAQQNALDTLNQIKDTPLGQVYLAGKTVTASYQSDPNLAEVETMSADEFLNKRANDDKWEFGSYEDSNQYSEDFLNKLSNAENESETLELLEGELSNLQNKCENAAAEFKAVNNAIASIKTTQIERAYAEMETLSAKVKVAATNMKKFKETVNDKMDWDNMTASMDDYIEMLEYNPQIAGAVVSFENGEVKFDKNSLNKIEDEIKDQLTETVSKGAEKINETFKLDDLDFKINTEGSLDEMLKDINDLYAGLTSFNQKMEENNYSFDWINKADTKYKELYKKLKTYYQEMALAAAQSKAAEMNATNQEVTNEANALNTKAANLANWSKSAQTSIYQATVQWVYYHEAMDAKDKEAANEAKEKALAVRNQVGSPNVATSGTSNETYSAEQDNDGKLTASVSVGKKTTTASTDDKGNIIAQTGDEEKYIYNAVDSQWYHYNNNEKGDALTDQKMIGRLDNIKSIIDTGNTTATQKITEYTGDLLTQGLSGSGSTAKDTGSGSGSDSSDSDDEDESKRTLKSEQELVNLERQRNRLEKERQELEEGGIWTAAARIKKLKQELALLEKERKIQEQILVDKKEAYNDIILDNIDKLNPDYYSIYEDEAGYIVYEWTDEGQKAVDEGLLDDETLEIYVNLQDAVNAVADQQGVVEDIDYQADEKNDEIFNARSEWIDQGVDWINSGIDAAGQLAQSAISMIQNVAQAAIDGFNSYLGWLTIKIDDDHDIGELDESLSNIVDRLEWEYEKLLKKQIAYNGTDSLNEKEVFENSNQSAKNVIARIQNQRRLYENSFRQLEDLGLNISSELTEAFESLYDRLYGADGPFTRLNKSLNNFKGKLEDVLPNVTSIFGEVKGVVGNLFSKGQEKIGDMMDKLFPNSIIDDIVDSIKIDNYSLGDFGKTNMQKLIELFTELTPSFNADYQIANKAELVDALSQKMETIITNDTITSQFVKGYLDYLTEVESQMESEVSNIRSSEREILDLYDTLTEILNRGKEEYSELAQDLYDAITDEKNSLLEELQALHDNITDADSEMLEILQANLDLIRQQRDNNDKERDLQAKEARLAYLRQDTSGANLQEILKLQDELEDEQQSYTDELIDQKISELETQNELAAEQRQVQIDLLQAEVDNTEGIWRTVEELLNGIAKFDKYLTGEIDRDGYKAIIEQLKKGQSYSDSSSVDKEETEKEWNSKIRAASLYRQVKDNLSDEYEYLKLAAATMDRETELPKDYAPNEGWHNYVAFSSLEQSIDRSNEVLKQAVTAINNLVEKITISYDDEQSLHMKTTYYGGVIQAVSGTEYAATKAVEDLASNAPGILTQLTTGIGNIAKGVMKSMGATGDSAIAMLENGIGLFPDVFGTGVDGGGGVTKLGDLGEAIGFFVEGMSNFAAAAADAASMGMDMIGDMAPGFADIGVAIATALKETFFNDYERVNNELEDNIDVIIDMMGNTLGTSGYLKEIRDGIQLAKNTRMGQPDDETYPIYDALQTAYRELMDDYKNLLSRDSERTDVEGFNMLYNRTLKLKEILGGFANYDKDSLYQEKLEVDPSRALEAIQKWRGEIGTLFTKIDKKVKDEIISLVNGILSTEGKTLGNKGVSRWIDIYDGIVMLDTSSTTTERVAAAMEEYEPELANKLYKLFDKQYASENTPQESFASFWSHKLTGIWGDISDFFSGFWDKIKGFFGEAVEAITGKSNSAANSAFDKFETYLTDGTIGEESKSTQSWLNKIFSSITNGIQSVIDWFTKHLGEGFGLNLSNDFKDNLTKLGSISTNTGILDKINNFLERVFGNAFASGGSITHSQRALVGEAGAELVQHANGGASYVAGPSLMNLEKGDVVYNASQTRKILSGDNLDFSRFAEGTATSMMARTAFGYAMPSVSLNLPDFDQSNKESTVNLNLNLEDLTVDTPDRVDEVAERVMDKISNTINGAMWPYNRLN